MSELAVSLRSFALAAVNDQKTGRLEIRGGGFAETLTMALDEAADKTLYLAARSVFVPGIMSRFGISRATAWEIEGGKKIRERVIPSA